MTSRPVERRGGRAAPVARGSHAADPPPADPRGRRRQLLARLGEQMSGSAPVSPVGRRAQRARLVEQQVREVLEVSVRFGEAMLSLGATASASVEVIRRTCAAFGLECQVDITFTAILVAHDGADAGTVSVLRVVQSRAADYHRLSRLAALAHDVQADPGTPVGDAADDPDAREAVHQRLERVHARLDEVLGAPHRYRPALVTASLALMAASVAVLLGGGVPVVLLSAATTAAVDLVLRRLGSWGLPSFFLQAAGAAMATTVAVALLALPGLPVELQALPPSLVVASGIIALLAGLSLVGAADDAINGFLVTASGRLLEVLLLTLGLVVGIGGVLDVANRLGVQLVISDTSAAPWPLAVQVVAAAAASGAWAASSFAGPRAAAQAAAWGALGYVVSALLVGAGAAAAVGAALAALVVGYGAESLALRTRVPAAVTATCAIVPLLPGLTIYQGLFAMISGAPPGTGGGLLLRAAMIGIGLAAGTTLGTTLADRARAARRRRPADAAAPGAG
ncbi:threonine/serine ThrE exporter family protein [Quadrisphaera setariae]|uniref:Threonine/serine exporter family protein n=1 Tax=Quadrisphaera setariae TaxID=2593304 RepID=A0A5C8ZLG5_9ACTN|nr:threonine/serine exporter family protein [Quadrisphaera setariae]TXR58021.1 threonine/serine exporter family protein [Quadrisphaera setariae]